MALTQAGRRLHSSGFRLGQYGGYVVPTPLRAVAQCRTQRVAWRVSVIGACVNIETTANFRHEPIAFVRPHTNVTMFHRPHLHL